MGENLMNILYSQRDKIHDLWLNAIMGTYSADINHYSRKKGTEFTDPVFYNLRNGSNMILDYVMGVVEEDDIMDSLETMIKIRAVQDFGASQAVAIFYLLKRILRNELSYRNLSRTEIHEVYVLEDRIDHVSLVAFDLYMKCREKIYEIRTNELKNNTWNRVADHESEMPVQT